MKKKQLRNADGTYAIRCRGCGKKIGPDDECYVCNYCNAPLCPKCSPAVWDDKENDEVYACNKCKQKLGLKSSWED